MTASALAFLRLLGLLWSLLRWRVVALGVLAAVLGVLAPLTVSATGWLVGAIPSAVDGSPGRAVAALAAVAACFAASGIGETAARISANVLGMSYAAAVWGRLGDRALALRGIAELEDPAMAGELAAMESLDRDGIFRQTVPALCTLVTARVGGFGAVALTFGLAWWAPFVLCAGWWLAAETADRWFARGFGAAVTAGGRGLRRASYFREMATGSAGAKEIRIFGLAEWLGGRYAHAWRDSIALVWQARRGGGAGIALGVGAVLVSHGAVFTALALAGIHGSLNPDTATVYVLAILRTESLGFLGAPQRIAAGATVAAGHVLALQRRLTRPPWRHSSVLAGGGAVQVDIRDLTFGYPGAERPILDRLSLGIPAGQSVAVVGVNGSGKSTLIKLLCGLYPLPSGHIRFDGSDVVDADPGEWRARLGVIFQDFVRYEMSLRDNVSLHGAGDSEVLAAAGADDLVSRLPDGWDTVLASGYAGGVDLSGGQWQRIALARALTAVRSGAGLLILDEPAAHLDVRAEAALFDRFLDLTAGVTTILVSHRLSGVRRADRIVVLDGGRIVEDGSHEELLARGGAYAAMFRLQAERFVADGSR